MTASASTMKAVELLKCSDSDFDMGIKEMGLKELLDTISSLQKEMSREQENFNSLSSELGALNKNSRQYKQIQKEMTASQNKLTALMNRSMKCFQQQGNQHVNKPGNPVQRRNSGRERSGSADSNVQRRHSARISGEEVVLIKSSFENPTVKSNPDLLNDVPSKPVILKPLNDLENSKLFVKKQNTVHSSTVAVKPQQITQQEKNVEIINGSNRNSSVSNSVNSSTVNVKSGNSSSAAQNGFRSSVTFNKGGNKPSSSQVNNKPVATQVVSKPAVNQNSDTKTINGVGEKPLRENLIARETESRKEQGQVYSSGITLKPTNSVINGETKKVNSASSEQPAAKSKSSMPPVVLQGSRPLITDSNVGANRDKLFDEIKNFKRKSDTVPDVKRPQEKEIFSSFKTGSVVEKSKESTESGAQKDVDKKEHEEVDSGTEDASGETSPEPEKFVSKYSFPQKPKRDPVKMEEKKLRAAPAPPVQGTVTQGQITTLRQNPVSTSLKDSDVSDGDGKSSGVDSSDGKGARVDLSEEEVAGVPVEMDEQDDEVAPVRVNLSNWDPTKLLLDLYSVKMMPDNVQDISDKFIAMEGLMEKLPMNKKKATLLKTWKRRFFRAKDGWLHYFESNSRDKPSESVQLMGGKVDDLGNRILGIDDGRGKFLMVRCPTDKEYGQWKLALESQTADNVKATYVRPALSLPPHPEKKVILIDIGSSAVRAGILSQEATLPQLFFPSTVSKNKNTGEFVVGIDAYKPEARHSSTMFNPIHPTVKVDKDYLRPFSIDMSTIGAVLTKVFTDLKVDSSEYWIMLSTPQNLADKIRAGLMEILVGTFNVKGVCMVMQSLLALYSYNTMSGIIVDIGERMEILPIYDGCMIEGGVSRQSYGGQKVAESLNSCLHKYKFSTPIDQLLIRFIKEQSCYVAEDYKDTKKKCEQDPDSYSTTVYLNNYDLPDGANVTVTHDYSCFQSPEGFFNTDLWGMDFPCVHKLVFQAIQTCPIDSRKRMYRAIYLSGGVTMLPGFAERLKLELSKLAPPSVVVEVHASPQRYHSAFIGACALANMEQFHHISISAEEWKKTGQKAFKKWAMG